MNPTVSVVIPAYGRPDFVNQALESVSSQTFSDYEVIIVDDGSGDECVSRYRLDAKTRLVRFEERRGPAAARNAGIAVSGGRYVAFLDMDDLWLPSKLKAQVDALDSSPDAGLAFCHYTLVNDELAPLAKQPRPKKIGKSPFRQLLGGNFIKSCSVVMVRRDAIAGCGGFDESLIGTDDWDLWLLISHEYELLSDPSSHVLYRVHSGQLSADSLAMRRAEVAVMNKWLTWAERSDSRWVATVRRSLAHKLQRLALAEARHGDLAASFRALCEAVRTNPWDPCCYLRLPVLVFRAWRAHSARARIADMMDPNMRPIGR